MVFELDLLSLLILAGASFTAGAWFVHRFPSKEE
jgi:hypothetical protein